MKKVRIRFRLSFLKRVESFKHVIISIETVFDLNFEINKRKIFPTYNGRFLLWNYIISSIILDFLSQNMLYWKQFLKNTYTADTFTKIKRKIHSVGKQYINS